MHKTRTSKVCKRLFPGQQNQDRALTIVGTGYIDILAIADGAGDTKHGGFAAECLLKAVKQYFQNKPSKISTKTFQDIHNKALKHLDNKNQNPGKKALAAYAIALVNNQAELCACSMGDVMFTVFRGKKVIFKTTEFVGENHWITKGLMLDYAEAGFNDIQVEKHQLKNGDLVIGASDGLWDNCRPEEISNYVDFSDSTANIISQLAKIPHDRKGYQDDRGIVVYRFSQ